MDLANSRTQSEARRLRLQATDTLYLLPPQPNQQMGKDAPYGPLNNGQTSQTPTPEQVAAVVAWMQQNSGAGGATAKS